MTSDELQATIERVEAKRRELTNAATRSAAGDGAKIISLLPKAAEYYGEQISLGLDGDPQAAAKARPIVRELLGGKVELAPGENGTLWKQSLNTLGVTPHESFKSEHHQAQDGPIESG